ncbi:MAG: GNAT family N-acetyltransferase, partial [Clostridia bacterium]|nr:GNAT family N-acetyltransferase [Clostridia bacterium]
MVRWISDPAEKARIAEKILTALPEWFGIPESTREYIEKSRVLPFWAFNEDGFIAMKSTSRYTAEIFVMGVMPNMHRMGIGRALVQALQAYAAENGYE